MAAHPAREQWKNTGKEKNHLGFMKFKASLRHPREMSCVYKFQFRAEA